MAVSDFFWNHPLTMLELFVDVAVIGILLLVSTIARRYLKLFQQYLVPNSLIAGFLGLILGPELLEWLPFTIERMGVYVYHLLAILFIGMGLRGSGNRSRGAIEFGLLSLMCYLLQAITGLLVALGVVFFFKPDLVPAIGLLLPLGFGMGPGLAYSIGQSWDAFGFSGAGSVGLTIAAVGFLVAYFFGVVLVKRGIRAGSSSLLDHNASVGNDIRTGIIKSKEPDCGARLTFFSGAIEPLSVHVALIAGVYLATYFVVKWLAGVFIAGGLEQEVALLWSFHFLLANLLALLVRRIMDGIGISYVLDSGLLNRINGITTDYLISASVMAISLSVAWRYALPISLITISGAVVTYFSLRWAVKRMFETHAFERFIGIFGEMTGTLSSGLALVRVSDPEFRTSVAQDLALGSGVALLFGFPLLFIINMPFTFFDGKIIGYWVVILSCVVYLGVVFIAWKVVLGSISKSGTDGGSLEPK